MAATISYHPTLLGLIDYLADERVTTPEQRAQIRAVLNDFLNNDVPHSKVYTYFGQIVGHQLLYDAVKSITREQVTSSSRGQKADTDENLEEKPKRLKLDTDDEKRVTAVMKGEIIDLSSKSRLPSIVVPIHGTPPLPVMRGHTSLPLDNSKAFILGAAVGQLDSGSVRTDAGTASSDLSPVPIQQRGVAYETIHVFNALELGSRQAPCYGDIPPPVIGASMQMAESLPPVHVATRNPSSVDTKGNDFGSSGTSTLALDSPTVLFYGGSHDGMSTTNTSVYALELRKRRWNLLQIPDGPSGVAFSANILWPTTESPTRWIFMPSLDGSPIWCLNLLAGSWSIVGLSAGPKSIGMPGCTLTPTPSSELFLYLGDDEGLWTFTFDAESNTATWTLVPNTSQVPRRHHQAALLMVSGKENEYGLFQVCGSNVSDGSCPLEIRCYSLNMYKNSVSCSGVSTIRPTLTPQCMNELRYLFGPDGLEESVAQYGGKVEFAMYTFTTGDEPIFLVCGGRRRILQDEEMIIAPDVLAFVLSKTNPFSQAKDAQDEERAKLIVDPTRVKYGSLAMAEYFRRVPVWMDRLAVSPGVFWALASSCNSPFIAISHLLDNSLKQGSNATKIDLGFAFSPEDKLEFCVSDNGMGMEFRQLHGLLKNLYSFEPGNKKRQPWRYGAGFNTALSRTSLGALVMTRTQQTVGVGLSSLRLMGHVETQQLMAPVSMWKLPSKELLTTGFPTVDQRHMQRLILQYSHYKTPSALAEQINQLGTESGTRVILFDIRDDLPCLCVDLATGSVTYGSNMLSSCNSRRSEVSWRIDDSNRRVLKATAQTMLPATFPLWNTESDAVDFNFGTFLYWSFLQNSAEMTLNDVPLIPSQESAHMEVEGSHPPCDRYRHSLYRFLKETLIASVELSFLLDKGDGVNDSYAIMGFLNPHNAAAVLGRQFHEERHTDIHEAGVLLYHRGRLIHRLHVPFHSSRALVKTVGMKGVGRLPMITAAVNVPTWLLPNASKSDFILRGSDVWNRFEEQLEELIETYIVKAKEGDDTLARWKTEREETRDT